MNPSESPYYPKRARWGARWGRLWYPTRRALKVEKLMPPIYRTSEILWGFLLPGYALWRGERRILARYLVLAYLLLALLFLIGMGYLAANLAFGLMISLHATSGIFMALRLSHYTDWGHKVRIAILVLAGTSLLIYMPLLRFGLPRYVLPLQHNDQVVVIRVEEGRPVRVQRGDWVAYRLAGWDQGPIRVRGGIGFERVQAVAGDRVEFFESHYEINGVPQSRREFMPKEGEWVVPDNCWIVWPNLAMSGRGAGQVDVSGVLQGLAFVPTSDYIGKPFQRWFWRKQ